VYTPVYIGESNSAKGAFCARRFFSNLRRISRPLKSDLGCLLFILFFILRFLLLANFFQYQEGTTASQAMVTHLNVAVATVDAHLTAVLAEAACPELSVFRTYVALSGRG
jgi:hypothetical protein